MNNIFKQIFMVEDNNEEPPSTMCNIEENSLYSRLFLVSVGRRWTILFGGAGNKSEFVVIPSIGNMFCR